MKENKTFRIDKDLVDQIKARAEAEHRTFSNMVISILKEWSESEKTKAA